MIVPITTLSAHSKGAMPVLVDQPWARVKDPQPIPAVDDLRGTLHELDDVAFAQLLRSNLVPADQLEGRERWAHLWVVLDRDQGLAERTFDVLEEFLDACDQVVDDASVDVQQRRRAAKFRRFSDDAWKRLENAADPDEPLAWAGRAARGFNPPARRVLQTLVDAIATHRGALKRSGDVRPADDDLWAVLGQVGLEPQRD